MTKQITIETPATEVAIYNLSREYNNMRASAKKPAIEATLKAMAMDICEDCYREQQAQEEQAPVETAESVEEVVAIERPTTTFIGPDGQNEILDRHNPDACDCEQCETYRWQVAERDIQRDLNRRERERQASIRM